MEKSRRINGSSDLVYLCLRLSLAIYDRITASLADVHRYWLKITHIFAKLTLSQCSVNRARRSRPRGSRGSVSRTARCSDRSDDRMLPLHTARPSPRRAFAETYAVERAARP